MLTEVKALVLRTVDLADNDKLLTLFTEEYGKLTAVANGSRTLKSRHLAAAQPFCYGSYVLYKKGERYWVREVSLIESFFDLRTDLVRMALASYVVDVADDVIRENAPEREFLRLTLNTLYATARGKEPPAKIKAVFEMRAAALLGFCPMLDTCADCGEAGGELCLDVMNGSLLCRNCRETHAPLPLDTDEDFRTARILCPLNEGALAALRYTVTCPPERLFAFRLEGEEEMRLFAAAAEKYLLNQLERSFRSLDFYKEVAD